ncbi:hypothetical protein C8J57DRAFT_1481010 [Mycena rebaudengoi]|nr:hypothetical protein C8J57DRAFT_1481010 [Mycena rebaudengoi]
MSKLPRVSTDKDGPACLLAGVGVPGVLGKSLYMERIREAKTQSCEGRVDGVSLHDHLPHHRPIPVSLPIERNLDYSHDQSARTQCIVQLPRRDKNFIVVRNVELRCKGKLKLEVRRAIEVVVDARIVISTQSNLVLYTISISKNLKTYFTGLSIDGVLDVLQLTTESDLIIEYVGQSRWHINVPLLASEFKWAGSNKCIDLTGGRIADGTALQLFTCDDGNALNTNQHWTSSDNPSELARQGIYAGNPNVQPPPLTGEPFCVGAASNADGAKVVLLGCGVDNASTDFPATNSTWMAPLVPLTGQFKTYDNKCLDVPNGENKNGIWTCAAGNTNQLFQMRRDRIEWKGSNMCLDLTDGNSTIGIQRTLHSILTFQLWDCATSSTNANQDIRTFLSS